MKQNHHRIHHISETKPSCPYYQHYRYITIVFSIDDL